MLFLLMLFNVLNIMVDSTSKFPHGERKPRLEEHPLSWSSCLESRPNAIFRRDLLWCVCGLWISLPLQVYSDVRSNQGGGLLCIPTLGQGGGGGESFAVVTRHSATTLETVLLCQLG